jgi:hypothetical protein
MNVDCSFGHKWLVTSPPSVLMTNKFSSWYNVFILNTHWQMKSRDQTIITPCLLSHWHPHMCLLAHSLSLPTRACTVSPQNWLTRFQHTACFLSLSCSRSRPLATVSIPLQWMIKIQLSIFNYWVNFHMVLHKSSLKVTVHKHEYLSCWLLSTREITTRQMLSTNMKRSSITKHIF